MFRRVGTAPIRDRCGGNQDVAGIRMRCTGLEHLLRGADIDAMHAAWRVQRNRPGHQGHLRARLTRGAGDGKAHLAAGQVADAAYRIQRFKGRPGRDQHALAL